MNKVAIVLGTSSKVGQAVAESLLRRGFLVFGGSREESEIDHEKFIDIELDIVQPNHILNFIEEIKKDTEVVDILVNVAGMCDMSSFDDTTDLDLRMHLETNVTAYFNFLKRFEPFILAEETHLINVFSTSAKALYPNTMAYSSSEFAKKAMLGILEKEWKKYQLRFSNFYVGAMDTPLWEDYPEVDVDKMLKIEDFIYMFEAIIDAPSHIQFPDITFLHKEGFID